MPCPHCRDPTKELRPSRRANYTQPLGHDRQDSTVELSNSFPDLRLTIETNPYRTPGSAPLLVDDDSTTVPRFRFAFGLLAYLYPVWLVSSFYSTWLMAWIQLGHRPRPMLDDPKSIGGLMDIAYIVPGFLVMAMPVLTPIGLAASFFCPVQVRRVSRYAQNCVLAVLYVALCALALLMLRADPGRVVEWWFD